MKIRRVREDDVDGLVDALGPATSAAQVRQRFEESQLGYRTMLVAEVDGSAAGTVSMGGNRFHRAESLRIFALDVGPRFRNCGVGTSLMRAAETVAVDMGLDEVNLEVSVENGDAIRLYERLGYERLPEQITDRWQQLSGSGSAMTLEEQSWIMTKGLKKAR